MPTQASAPHVIDPVGYAALRKRLGAIERGHPELATLIELLLQPLSLLQAMQVRALPALGDDQLAVADLVALTTAGGLLPTRLSDSVDIAHLAEHASDRSALPFHRPGIVQPLGLVLLGLAGLRAAAANQRPNVQHASLAELVRACIPVEYMAKQRAAGPVREFLAGLALTPREDVFKKATLAITGMDPGERRRLRALSQLLESVRRSVEELRGNDPAPWDGATAAPIETVVPEESESAGPVRLRLRGDFEPFGAGDWNVVLGAPGRPPAEAELLEPSADGAVTEVGADVSCGWVGLTSPQMLSATNQFREGLQAWWQQHWSDSEHLPFHGYGVREFPPELIPQLEHPVAPPRTASNHFRLSRASSSRERPAVVVVRPRVLVTAADASDPRKPPQQVGTDDVAAALDRAARRLGRPLPAVEPPWVEDELAVLEDGAVLDGARIESLLTRLGLAALRTPGLEGAVWLLVLPAHASGFRRARPAEAARAVGVATVDEVPRLLDRALRDAEPLTPRRCFRLSARQRPDGGLALVDSGEELSERELPREATGELHGEGGFVAVGLDAAGEEVVVHGLRKSFDAGELWLTGLFPSQGVERVEVRRRVGERFVLRPGANGGPHPRGRMVLALEHDRVATHLRRRSHRRLLEGVQQDGARGISWQPTGAALTLELRGSRAMPAYGGPLALDEVWFPIARYTDCARLAVRVAVSDVARFEDGRDHVARCDERCCARLPLHRLRVPAGTRLELRLCAHAGFEREAHPLQPENALSQHSLVLRRLGPGRFYAEDPQSEPAPEEAPRWRRRSRHSLPLPEGDRLTLRPLQQELLLLEDAAGISRDARIVDRSEEVRTFRWGF